MNQESFLESISAKYFGLFCHQDSSILFQINGDVIPLCPRCIGLHLGFIISILVLTVAKQGYLKIFGKYLILFIIGGLGLMALEWTFAHLSIIHSTHISRLLTGLITGFVLGILLWLYKNEYTRPFSFRLKTKNRSKITSIITLLVFSCLILIFLNVWIFIMITLLISVSVNLFIIIHTIIMRLLTLFEYYFTKESMP